jgi:hypothetical protein
MWDEIIPWPAHWLEYRVQRSQECSSQNELDDLYCRAFGFGLYARPMANWSGFSRPEPE